MSRRQAVFGITPAGALVGARLQLVEEAWHRLSVAAGKHCVVVDSEDNNSLIPLPVLLRHYDANRHPLHMRGWTSRGRLQDLFETSFKKVAVSGPEPNVEYVAHGAFVDFYVKLSAEVQVMRQKGEAALDPDAFFCQMVEQTWHLDEEWGIAGQRKLVTVAAVSPVSAEGEGGGSSKTAVKKSQTLLVSAESDSDDECHNSNMNDVLRPTGVKAMQSVQRLPTDVLDLVWAVSDAATGKKQLVGFRGVVRPLFPRAAVPAPIRGHFLLPAESAESHVKFLATRPSNQPSLDFVWPDMENLLVGGSGSSQSPVLIGLQGVVSSSVDMVAVPEEIRRHLFTPAQSSAANVQFAPTEKPPCPILFKKLSDEYGMDAVPEARRTAALKKAVFEGTACGNVYATTWSGKFSDQFPAGPWRQAGLNTSASKPRVYFG